MFQEATVFFTNDYANSLPQKLTKYADAAEKMFSLVLLETGLLINLALKIKCLQF